MSAISFAKSYVSAFREKPHSSITDWVDILTSASYEDEAYDGIPELVDSINLQAAGPTEASRALRKKLKHGDPHQQYRALVILKALVDNGGQRFQTSFADGQLTDALRNLSSDSTTDPKVKKKVLSVFASWHTQFKNDPSMSIVANLYRPPRSDTNSGYRAESTQSANGNEQEKRKLAKEEAKKKAKEAKEAEKARREEEAKKRVSKSNSRKSFNFEQERPQILSAIATASQTANNLVNAIILVNPEHDSLQANDRVQECLANAKQVRKQIVRYIQLVENEDMIGTLIETNDRIIAAIETYDQLSQHSASDQDVSDVQNGLAATNLVDSELGKLQDKQRATVERSIRNGSVRGRDRNEHGNIHPELQDLTFGTLGGAVQSKLPPPIRPSAPRSDDDEEDYRISLSDYSDYASSDEVTHNYMAASSSTQRGYLSKPGAGYGMDNSKHSIPDEDPFADPFADAHGVAAPIPTYH